MTITPSTVSSITSGKYSWRVVDIVIAAVIGVASGVIFWAWQFVWGAVQVPLAFLPGLSGLTAGGWLFAGVLGGIIVRKPGAAFFTEIVAAVVSMAIGTQWGWETLYSGLVQGLGAEIVLAVFLYSNWRVGVAVLAGVGAGVGLLAYELLGWAAAMDSAFKVTYAASVLLSGATIAGLGSWALARALARTGVLNRFAAGKEAATTV
jgi:energy-coupling factor transport system permease protein